MLFSEIELYEAVHDVRVRLGDGGEFVGSDIWTVDLEKREQLCRLIQARLPIGAPYTSGQMIDAWVSFRKRGEDKAAMTIVLARTHGRRCFWKARGLGNCCEEVTIDRLIPGSKGGAYTIENCVLSCRTHNVTRRDRSVEDFLRDERFR